jgi:hypothetical protein
VKKHHKSYGLPPRRDTRITSQYIPKDGSMVISVARGFTGAGEVLYRIDAEKLAGAIEDRKELAVIVNNLGLLVLAQLCGFNLADSLDEIPKALAQWAHIDVKQLVQDDTEEALRIAQRTIHGKHGQPDSSGAAPAESDCGCRGEGPNQTICASFGCGFCSAAETSKAAE